MTTESGTVLRAAKNSRIILDISTLFDVSLEKAAEIFYNSAISDLIEEGVADLQCRSDKYLATLIWDEHREGCVNN
ncbi:MAG: DUF3791 domain-containing protein [Paramuribaculum sp.]|nr:DUF3791 domain-containing protein [Paramuribaculum sp.]MDE7452147.1 DUF3791 domain-containing protein [Paramuribaculum sp.]